MRKLSLIGLLSAAFMFTQIPLSVDYSLDFLNVLTLLNHPVSNPMFILSAPVYKKWTFVRQPWTVSCIHNDPFSLIHTNQAESYLGAFLGLKILLK